MVSNVQEIRAAQMLVALRLAGVNRRGVYDYLESRSCRIGWVEDGVAADFSELAANIGDHQVPHAEMCSGVDRINLPLGWLRA
jgi:hypothetical protein